MVRSRLGLKILGLCALALGLMAFASSAAQAEVGAFWSIKRLAPNEGELFKIPNGPGGVVNLQPLLEINGLENKTGTLEFKTAGGTLVKILCTDAKFDEGGNLLAQGAISLGRVHFTGCKVELNSAPAPACQAHSPGKAAGEILSEKGKGLIVLDVVNTVTQDYVKIIPEKVNAKGETETSKLFAKIEMGEECAIGTLVNVEAKSLGEGLWIEDCLGSASFLEEKVEHLIKESLKGLIALGQPAVIEGSAFVRLGPGHAGQKWGGTPG
jgi:hypothetical protein